VINSVRASLREHALRWIKRMRIERKPKGWSVIFGSYDDMPLLYRFLPLETNRKLRKAVTKLGVSFHVMFMIRDFSGWLVFPIAFALIEPEAPISKLVRAFALDDEGHFRELPYALAMCGSFMCMGLFISVAKHELVVKNENRSNKSE
jgi:hypothetical protein